MNTKSRSNRQIKKLVKKQVFYDGEKIYRIVPVHSTEIAWWNAIEGDNVKKTMSSDDAEDELRKMPVGSYVIHYGMDVKDKTPSWLYSMKTICTNCRNKCGDKEVTVRRKFGKDYILRFKKSSHCELKNKMKGFVHWGKL